MRFVNVPHAYQSTARLVRALAGTAPVPATIGADYREAISTVRPFPAPHGQPSVTFDDGEWAQLLTRRGIFDNIFTGVQATTAAERRRWRGEVTDALEHLRKTHPELARIVDLLVTDIVVLNSRSKGGGSASHLPGLVVMSPGVMWTVDDYAETIVHEATHLLLFVLDMVYGLYTMPASRLDQPACYVVSAVKVGVPRPLDKALHSAVVAVPLMYMQHMRGETGLVDAFTASLRECCAGLRDKAEYFTPYGWGVVEELSDFADTLDYDRVRRSLVCGDYLAAA